MREVPVLLFEKCPRIESFKGDLSSLINYVAIYKGQNCIKSITVTDFGDFQSDRPNAHENVEEDLTQMKEAIKSGIRLLAENLIHLETMELDHGIFYHIFYNDGMIHDTSQEYLEQLGQKASTIASQSAYRDLYQKFKPGSNLLKLICEWDLEGLPQELPERHPNLRSLCFVDVSLDSFRVLNGLQFLESVELIFNAIADNVLEMFRSFLSRHIHLKRLKLIYIKHSRIQANGRRYLSHQTND